MRRRWPGDVSGLVDGEVGVVLTPMQNAPPKSLRATQGQGSRVWSIRRLVCMWSSEGGFEEYCDGDVGE